MEKFKIEGIEMMVPTYNGKWLEDTELADFDDPEVPVLVCPADGVKIILGTHNYHDCEKPDIQVERRHNGWMIFLHPLGGCDASGYVVFLDDGRSYVVPEHGYGPTDRIELVEYEEAIGELDDIKPSGLSCSPTMIVDVQDNESSETTQNLDRNAHVPSIDGPAVDDCHERELSCGAPATRPDATVQFPCPPAVVDAFESAQKALAGDSNDDEHDALFALVEALEGCKLRESAAATAP